MTARRLPWTQIRDEYVFGTPDVTLEKLAGKFACSVDAVRQKSAKEHWPDQRAQAVHEISIKAREIVTSEEVEIRARQLREGKMLQAFGASEIQQRFREAKNRLPKDFEPSELRLMIVQGAELERKAFGIADETKITHNFDPTKLSDEELEAIVRARRPHA